VAVATQEFSLEQHLCLFLVQAAELHLVRLQTERLVAVVAQIKTVDKQVLQVLLDEAELTLLVVLVQLETQVVQQLDRCLATVLICKVAHRVTKQILKVAVAAAVVTTAVVVVPIKLQVVDQKMVAEVAVPAT
jgi:hypothetical protein